MRVCVYASSSPKTSSAFVAQGRRLGRLLAERGHVLINGGGKFGGMGALNEGCRAAGGVIECVIHEMDDFAHPKVLDRYFDQLRIPGSS